MIEAAIASVDITGPPLPLGVAPSPPDRRIILVDGFNVLHAVLLSKEREAGWWRRSVREELLRRVAAWRHAEDEVWVAFDGAQPAWSVWAEPVVRIESHSGLPSDVDGRANPARRATIHSVYVESADDWIVRRARRANQPERFVIVSADRQVTGRARSAGCEIWSPWTFMSRCPRAADESAWDATEAEETPPET